jgi:hypothetical protein
MICVTILFIVPPGLVVMALAASSIVRCKSMYESGSPFHTPLLNSNSFDRVF